MRELRELGGLTFEVGSIRPPSEGGSYSLLLRVTRNCPWSRCAFCYGTPYNREKFQLRPVEEIKKDVNTVKEICEVIKGFAWRLGYAGRINELVGVALSSSPWLQNNPCFAIVFNWQVCGAKTVFFQDADSLIMKTPGLVEVIKYLKETFPSIERITSYARSKTAYKKDLEELIWLSNAGLNRLHIGLESGDEEVLVEVNKGVTAEQHIIAGKKVKQAGIELSEYVMPGLGGRAKWKQHAENTARVLNEINPYFIRMRPLVPRRVPDFVTPLFEAYQKGEFELTSPHERLRELKLMVENLDITGRLCFDHFVNPQYKEGRYLKPLLSQDYNGYKFPEQKPEVLELIEKGLAIDESCYLWAKDLASLPNL